MDTKHDNITNMHDVEDLINELSEEELSSIEKILKKETKKPTYRSVVHNYVCELCSSRREKSYIVKLKGTSPPSTKEVTLPTICDRCKRVYIVGLAIALSMVRPPTQQKRDPRQLELPFRDSFIIHYERR